MSTQKIADVLLATVVGCLLAVAFVHFVLECDVNDVQCVEASR